MLKQLTPAFLRRLDQYLLENYPLLWVSRIHHNLWTGLLLWLFSAACGALLPVNIDHPPYGLWYFLFTLIGLVLTCIWVYRFCSFNREKSYGQTRSFDEYLNFVLVIVSLGMFLLAPLPFEYVYNNRVADTMSDEKLVSDINLFNLTSPYFAFDPCSEFKVYREREVNRTYADLRYLDEKEVGYYSFYYHDHGHQLNGILSDSALISKYDPNIRPDSLTSLFQRCLNRASAYGLVYPSGASDYARQYIDMRGKKVYCDEVTGSARVWQRSELKDLMNTICHAKFKKLFIFKADYWYFMLYLLLTLSALVLLFKMVPWRQLIITAVICIFFPIVLFILGQLVISHGNNFVFFSTGIFLFLAYSLFSVFRSMGNNTHFRAYGNIMNQVCYISFLYWPLLLLAFLYENTDLFHNQLPHYYEDETRDSYQGFLSSFMTDYWRHEYRQWRLLAVNGAPLLFIAVLPLFKTLFVKQLSLPRKS